VAALAVRVTLVHGEADVIVLERAVAGDGEVEPTVTLGARARRREERVAALGAEEVLLVVRPLAERIVVERDEALVNDRRLAMVATRCKDLCGSEQWQSAVCLG
jgi:hypothetical protein